MKRSLSVGAGLLAIAAVIITTGTTSSAAPVTVPCSIDANVLTCPLPAPVTVTSTVTSTVTAATTAGSSSSGTTTTAGSTTTTSTPPTGGPIGIPGSWTRTFTDEFSGTALDTGRWNSNEGKKQNGVYNHASNVAVGNGVAVLTLPSSSSGAMLSSGKVDNWGTDHYLLPVGSVAEARILFPGSGTTINNWPAWWAVGNGWPANGENDVAEGLGHMTVNYHSSSKNWGATIPGTWAAAYHTYAIHRRAGNTDVYYDGVLVATWTTADPGIGHALILNLGNGYGPAVYGAASQVRVDYVRAWAAG